jgi:hypothetical protein
LALFNFLLARDNERLFAALLSCVDDNEVPWKHLGKSTREKLGCSILQAQYVFSDRVYNNRECSPSEQLLGDIHFQAYQLHQLETVFLSLTASMSQCFLHLFVDLSSQQVVTKAGKFT